MDYRARTLRKIFKGLPEMGEPGNSELSCRTFFYNKLLVKANTGFLFQRVRDRTSPRDEKREEVQEGPHQDTHAAGYVGTWCCFRLSRSPLFLTHLGTQDRDSTPL